MKRYGLYPEMRTQGDWCLSGSEGGRPGEWIFLGRLAEYGRRYKVKFDVTKEKVVAIVGKRGQGKSYTLGSFVEGLCASEPESAIGVTARRRGVLVFDTLNIFQWLGVPISSVASRSPEMSSQASVLESWGLPTVALDTSVWIPAGHRYRWSSASHTDLYLNVPDFSLDDWSALLDLDVVRDIKGQYFTEVYQKVVSLGWHDQDSFHVAKEDYTISDLIECIQNDKENELSVFRADTRRAVLQQLRAYERHPIFSGPGTPLNHLIVPGQASVVLLSNLPEDLRGVVVSVIVKRLLRERAEASEAMKDLLINPSSDEPGRAEKERIASTSVPKTWVVIDEAQNIIPAGRQTSASVAVKRFVREGRNFGLSFLVTTQQPRALDLSVLSQVETFVVHKLVSQSDIDYILDNLKSPLPTEIKDADGVISIRELIRDIAVGQAMVSDANTSRCFVMEVRPRVSAHGGFEA